MLSEYEASTLVRTKAAGINRAPRRPLEPNRIGVALAALSLLSALALLYSAWFDWTPGPRTAQAVPVSTIAVPMIHPATSGLPEAALFLRHPLRENADENLADMAVLRRGTSAR
ncbi:MAG: hypothetical protein K2Y71_04715 [Xanthobacteraceae bacterium]|nr:hypothetical protein [Xanthobacteraceae bacterium]